MPDSIDLHKVLDVIQGCHIQDYEGMTPATAATAMKAIIMGSVRAVMENYKPVSPKRSDKKFVESVDICKRGSSWRDEAGNPWPHSIPEETGVCVFCGYGAKEPPPEAVEKKPTEDRKETVICGEHGFHQLTVHPDGSYDKPDCRMFKPEEGE